jgi:hypothetical protein
VPGGDLPEEGLAVTAAQAHSAAAAYPDAGAAGLRGVARLAIEAAAVVAAFASLERWLMWTCRLPAESYFEPVIALELARALARHELAVLAFLALVALRGRLLWRSWTELEHGNALRIFVAGLAFVFAWTFSSYEPNAYFDRTHAVDRLLLVALSLLVLWRPCFLLAFLPLLLAVVWQFDHPLGGYSWTDKTAPLRVLLLFLASFLWLAATGGRRAEVFLFTACCLVAAHYWIPGLEKLQLGWLAHGRLHHLTLAAWENGWLVSLDPAEIASFARTLARGEPIAMAFTIAVEAGALLFLWRRGVALALLAAWALLHAGIFATSGLCFWKWGLLDLGLIALLCALRRSPSAQAIFGPAPLLLSLALIAGASAWCAPVRLGWFDTRIAYTFRYTVLVPGGGAYRIAPSFFAPYDLPFAQNRFDYLTERPALVSTYGMTQDPRIAGALLPVRTLAEVEALEARMGRSLHDAQKAARFDAFMRRFLVVRNRHGAAHSGLHALSPPLHIWTAAREPAYAGQGPVERLLVDRVTTLWDGERLLELRVERVRELAIDPGSV